MLGHASPAMTLDRYSDLYDADLDAVAGALDAVRAAGVSRMLPGVAVVPLLGRSQRALSQ